MTDRQRQEPPCVVPKPSSDKIGFDEFVWIWNDLQGLKTPALHLEICRWLSAMQATPETELLLMAFRNSGKSTLVGLYAAWLLACTPHLRILVIAADHALARKMVRNVKRIIERHPLTTTMKPDSADQWAGDQFTVNRQTELRDPSMLAKGIGANLTGSRADVIVYDDVEVPNTADTAPKREDLRERLMESEYVLVPGGLKLFVGTPHTFYSIYSATARLETGETQPFLHGFQRLELPIVDDAGNSRWPERFPLAEIGAIRNRTGPNRFESQMMLRPVNINDSRLNPDRLRLYDAPVDFHEANGEQRLMINGARMVSASAWWDPSFGAVDRGDASVLAIVFTDAEGTHWLHDIQYLTFDADVAPRVDEATQLCRQVASAIKTHCLPAVMVETNGIGRFLPGLLRREIARSGVRAAVLEKTSVKNKDLRIVDAFDAVLSAGKLRAHRRIWDTPFVGEMREWRPGHGGRDDGLDAVAGCLLAEPVRIPRLTPAETASSRDRTAWRGGGKAFKAKSDFAV